MSDLIEHCVSVYMFGSPAGSTLWYHGWKAVQVKAEVTRSVSGCWDGSWHVRDSGSGYGHACEQVGRSPNQETWSLLTPSCYLWHLASVLPLKSGANKQPI